MERGERERLDVDRTGIAHHFTIIASNEDAANPGSYEVDGYLHVNTYADGRVGEIFFTVGKQGDNLSGMLRVVAKLFSKALQHGAPFEELCRAMLHDQFAPYGATKNPDISRCKSITDYTAKYLMMKFGKPIMALPEMSDSAGNGHTNGGAS